MEFDHLGDKIMDIARMTNSGCSVERLLAEVAKCELVCANCHRVRTWNRTNEKKKGV